MSKYLYVYALYRVACSETHWLYFRTFLQSLEDSFYIKNTCFNESQVAIFSMFVILVLTITQSLLQTKFLSISAALFLYKVLLSLALPFSDNICFEICYPGKDIWI